MLSGHQTCVWKAHICKLRDPLYQPAQPCQTNSRCWEALCCSVSVFNVFCLSLSGCRLTEGFPNDHRRNRNLLWLDQTELQSGFSWVICVKTWQTSEVFTASEQWSYTDTHNVNTTQCSSSMWVKYGWFPAHVEPSMIVFVDSGVVLPQRKHSGQRGYQWTRLTDAGVPLHVVSLIESAQAIWTDFEDIMKIPMIFIGRLGPLCVTTHLYFAFLVFNLHHYWFLYFFTAWCFLGTFPHTDWLINLKVFIAPSVIRGD